jgi:hypothetical protein
MTGTNCDLFTHKSSRSYLNHLVFASDNFDVFYLEKKTAAFETLYVCEVKYYTMVKVQTYFSDMTPFFLFMPLLYSVSVIRFEKPQKRKAPVASFCGQYNTDLQYTMLSFS